MLETLGNKVYYADDRAKWLMQNDKSLKAEIIDLFGKGAYKNGDLDRKFIADQVFLDQHLLSTLNGKVHPVVGKDLQFWIDQNRTENLLFDEAALLFEIGTYKKMHKTILVTAPEEIRISRVLARDSHRSKEAVKDIIAKQMSDDEKRKLADFVIVNDGAHSIIRQVMEVYQSLQP